MRILYLSTGHYDSELPLISKLARSVDLTFAVLAVGDHLRSNIVDCDISQVPHGAHLNLGFDHPFSVYFNRLTKEKVKVGIIKYFSHSFCDLRNVPISKSFSKIVKNDNYHVIHYNGDSALILQQHLFLTKVSKIFTVHDPVLHMGEANIIQRFRNYILRKTYTAEKNSLFIVHANTLKNQLSLHYKIPKNRIYTVFYGPMDTYRRFIVEQIAEEPYTVLFFGRISPYKGIETLIAAAEILKKDIRNIKVIIAGEGSLEAYPDLKSNIFEVHHGYISNRKLARLFQRASVVCAPYIDATQSGVIQTAYAFEKPVVASNVGGIPEVVKDNVTGRLVAPGEPNQLAGALVDILLNQKKRERMKENIKRIAREELSWDNIATQTAKLYRDSYERFNCG